MSSKKKVIVLGAGVIGLSSAVAVKQAWPDIEVEVVAEKFSPDTTSDGSGGFWEPYATGKTDPKWIREVSHQTYVHLKRLALSNEAASTGATVLSGYGLFTDVDAKRDFFHDLVDGYREVTESELAYFPAAKSGFFFTTTQVDVTTYLTWLTARYQAIGGKLRKAKVHSLKEFSPHSTIVINCCGIGARALLGDDNVQPISGQVLKVQAPWVKHFYVLQEGDGTNIPVAYVLPGTSGVVVGGTAEVGDWTTDPSPEVAHRIWTSATQFLPMLKEAKIIKHWKGLRPGRTSVRLEPEEVDTASGSLKVVHNYGHGGSGITLHWGCALKVVGLVGQLLGRSTKVKANL